MPHPPSKSRENSSEDKTNTRRSFLRKGATGIAATALVPGLAAAKSSDVRVFHLKKKNWHNDINRIKNTKGVSVKTTQTEYVVSVDTSVLPNATPTEQQKIESRMHQTRREAENQLQGSLDPSASSESSDVSTQAIDPVSLGSNKTFYDMTTGSTGSSNSGFVVVVASGNNYNTSSDIATAAILAGTGLGSTTLWATIGVPFSVSGSGSQTATIQGNGRYKGQITTEGAGEATVTFDFRLHDHTSGTTYRTNIYSESHGVAAFSNFANTYNEAMTATLTAGHTYTAFARVTCTVGVGTIGEADADAGPQDGDDYTPPQGVVLDSVSVVF